MRDENNATETWHQYDAFGRLTYRWLPGDTAWTTGQASQAYGYHDTLRRLYTRLRDDDGASPSYLESWQFYSVPVLCRPTAWGGPSRARRKGAAAAR